ncbi:hypothetical protein ERJ75_001037200 [Trypanosoma vivax]|nr:hypothetical protein ERJ75_001037200 [Trypanosoma vivax]
MLSRARTALRRETDASRSVHAARLLRTTLATGRQRPSVLLVCGCMWCEREATAHCASVVGLLLGPTQRLDQDVCCLRCAVLCGLRLGVGQRPARACVGGVLTAISASRVVACPLSRRALEARHSFALLLAPTARGDGGQYTTDAGTCRPLSHAKPQSAQYGATQTAHVLIQTLRRPKQQANHGRAMRRRFALAPHAAAHQQHRRTLSPCGQRCA